MTPPKKRPPILATVAGEPAWSSSFRIASGFSPRAGNGPPSALKPLIASGSHPGMALSNRSQVAPSLYRRLR